MEMTIMSEMEKLKMRWEAVLGLEIHSELNTKSKLFSTAPNRFGDEPNSNITEVCTGLPGVLPVLNKEAVKKAVQLGCALNARIAKFSKFDRKSYFYPDSPRNFQITQFDEPIVIGGEVIAEVDGQEHRFGVHHVHLEDDAGMLKHFSRFAGVDYNRAGVPLVEIVSEPFVLPLDKAASYASAYAMAVRAILQYIDASDCNMQEGSLRFDANISVRKIGEKGFRQKVEIKNMNSFSNMELAVNAEIRRQIELYEENPDRDPNEIMQQATYRWDADLGETVLMRKKESADDYRYFPEPDLPPIVLTDLYIEEIRAALPELPLARERRYVNELGLAPHAAFLLASDKPIADYFERGLQSTKNARALCNWITIEFSGRIKDSGKSLLEAGIRAEDIGQLVDYIDSGKITGKIAKAVADEMVAQPGRRCAEIVASNPDYMPVTNSGEIEAIIDRVLAANPQSIEDLKNGKERAFGFLVGQVMKETKGKASPQIVNELLNQKLGR
jgi:aspartyl-tRNA(Asn)/glutamyl-tRNA(Gln) amidotransferase subunit B